MEKLSRRGLVAVLAGAGLALGSTRRAMAFSEPTTTVQLRALHDSACGATSAHKQLVEQVDLVLGDKYTAEEKKAVVANMVCPICGCPLSGLF